MNRPLLVVTAIILDNNKVLLVKRAREPFKGYWSFIGGVGEFEQSSDPQEVVKKEVVGEINCVFSPVFFTYSYNDFSEYDLKSVNLFFYGEIEGTIKINPQTVLEYKWVPVEEAVTLNLGFDHSQILRKFLRTRNSGVFDST